MEKTIPAYFNGSFIEMAYPEWYKKTLDLQEEEYDWNEALSKTLETDQITYPVHGTVFPSIYVRLWASEKFGGYVELWAGAYRLSAIYVPQQLDWWPFHAQYLTPIINSAIALDGFTRIGNAMISRGRYGKGQHINRSTGLSRVDAQIDAENQLAARWREQNGL